MTVPLVVLRPEPGNAETVRRVEALGLSAIGAPLLSIEPVPWEAPAPERFDALILGSANAIRLGGSGLDAFRHLPVYAVGAATAEAARSAGFTVAAVGDGNLQAMLGGIVGDGRCHVLRIAGAERVPLDPPPDLAIATAVVYAAHPRPLSVEAMAALRSGAIAALHSAAAARVFAEACDEASLARDRVALACLSPRIVAAAGDGWAAVEIAGRPDDSALLALAREMCQSRNLGATHHKD